MPIADIAPGYLSPMETIVVGLGLVALVGIVIVAFVSSYMRG